MTENRAPDGFPGAILLLPQPLCAIAAIVVAVVCVAIMAVVAVIELFYAAARKL